MRRLGYYYFGDQIKDVKAGGRCISIRSAYKNLFGKPEG
jgi:hypothetical protein